MMYLDEIIEAVGGMSRFQVMVVFGILGPKIAMVGGMMMMAFAGVPPEHWGCVDVSAASGNVAGTDGTGGEAQSIMSWNTSLKYCPSDGNSSRCTFVYSAEKHTVVNEWDLLCDKKQIPPTMTAVQMGGVLIGSLLAGYLADAIGRKKTYYLSMLLHAGFILMTAFSVSWQMFMALRFCIGLMVGGLLCVYYPYFLEFVGAHWRPMTGAIPFWQIGSALLALITWLRPNWSDAHIIAAAVHIPFFIGWFFVPESVRWLAVHGRLGEAETVVDQMARYNGRMKPDNTTVTLKMLREEELEARVSGAKYSYMDIYRGWKLCLTSLLIQVIWFFVSFVFYGISFGVGRLTGNLYLNMFLIGLVDTPAIGLSYFLNNRIGRRWAGFIFFAISTCGAFGVAIASKVVKDAAVVGPLTTTLALVSRMGVAAAWTSMQLHTSETYPTAIRNMGYGAASVVARMGGIVSPYAFTIVSGDDLCPPFLIVGSTMALCTLLTLLLKETLGVPLEDTTRKISEQCQTLLTQTDLMNTSNETELKNSSNETELKNNPKESTQV